MAVRAANESFVKLSKRHSAIPRAPSVLDLLNACKQQGGRRAHSSIAVTVQREDPDSIDGRILLDKLSAMLAIFGFRPIERYGAYVCQMDPRCFEKRLVDV